MHLSCSASMWWFIFLLRHFMLLIFFLSSLSPVFILQLELNFRTHTVLSFFSRWLCAGLAFYRLCCCGVKSLFPRSGLLPVITSDINLFYYSLSANTANLVRVMWLAGTSPKITPPGYEQLRWSLGLFLASSSHNWWIIL